jgi:hypothetical protein
MESVTLGTHYHIYELRRGLRIRAKRDLEQWERLVYACFAAVVAGAATASLLGSWWWLGVSAISALAALALVKSQKAELVVTPVEFTTTGDLGRRVQTSRIVLAADIRRLEFRGGGLLILKHDGLYAVTDRRELCVLPFLDWEQANQVIHAIEKRFPGLAENWRLKGSLSV